MAHFKTKDLEKLQQRPSGQQFTMQLPHSSATVTAPACPPPATMSALLELVDTALRHHVQLPAGMRALSLLQPWASLVAWRLKHLETRSWSTAYRGPMAVHASLGKPRHVRVLCEHDEYLSAALQWMGHTFDELPRGGIVAVVNMQLCKRILPEGAHAGKLVTNAREVDPLNLTAQEVAFGDYSPGRFAWELVDVLRLHEPVPAKGSLSLWEIPAVTIATLQTAMRAQP